MSSLPKAKKHTSRRKNLIWERTIAILALVNLGLVFFDLSYVSLRDFYLRELPRLTKVYDPIKGIEPHRDTEAYLATVDELQNQVIQTGLQSPEVAVLLEELRDRSTDMVETNPFQIANKTGTLEKIKNRMRDRVGQDSSREAFQAFWSQAYLSKAGWQQENNFFETRIQPLIRTNYYRSLGETGDFLNRFWIIDLPFVIIFGLEFLGRTFYISRRRPGVSWIDAMVWRWYDILLLLPFWRWLRVIPVTIRLYQAELLNLEPVRASVNESFVANFSEQLTESVIVRAINQAQHAIRKGDVVRWLTQTESQTYVNINGINEIEAIATLVLQLIVYEVLPRVQPDLEALLRHSIESALNQSPVYQGLQKMPGVGHLPNQITERLVNDLTRNAYSGLVASLEDPVAAQLTHRLMQRFSEVLGSELTQEKRLQEIEVLVADLLEEIKINYVKRLSEEDLEALLDETRQLRLRQG